jgi:hypothetical protein
VLVSFASVEGSGVGSAAVVVGRAALSVRVKRREGRRGGTAAAPRAVWQGRRGAGAPQRRGNDPVRARMAWFVLVAPDCGVHQAPN